MSDVLALSLVAVGCGAEKTTGKRDVARSRDVAGTRLHAAQVGPLFRPTCVVSHTKRRTRGPARRTLAERHFDKLGGHWFGLAAHPKAQTCGISRSPIRTTIGFDGRAFNKARAFLQSSGLASVFTLYAAALDGDSHKFRDHGFSSVDAAQSAGLRFVDSEITHFVSELEQQHPEIYEKTLFFLIADHGHTENDAGRKIDLGTLRFPGESTPGDLFRVKANGFMAHLYVRVGAWSTYLRLHRSIPS